MLKRCFDFTCSLIGLVVISPLLLLASLLVIVDSGTPVFYRQQRTGRNNQPFTLLKFRSMHVNADKSTAITVGNRDPRITRVGYYLRRYKLDELPQLINVLVGDMSLVGPRPELKKFTDLYTTEQKQVLGVRPGMTDPASIAYRNENEMLAGLADPIDFYIREIMPRKLEINLQYIRTQSFWGDLGILFKTVFSIFR